MMNDQHAHVCLGHRADNRIVIPETCLAQNKAALLVPYMIVLSSVLLVRPAFAQEFGRLSPVQEPPGPCENPFGDCPGDITTQFDAGGTGHAAVGRERVARTASVAPSFSGPPAGSALGRPQRGNLRRTMDMPINA